MNQSLYMQVLRFHELGGVPVKHRPEVPDVDRVKLRLRLITEEFFELLAACSIWPKVDYHGESIDIREFIDDEIDRIDLETNDVNLVEVADALADLDYVVEGTRLEFGILGQPVADEVHRANMTKFLRCPDCKGSGRREKVIMGPVGSVDYVEEIGDCSSCDGRGATFFRDDAGKVIKPPHWEPPNIAAVLEAQGWER